MPREPATNNTSILKGKAESTFTLHAMLQHCFCRSDVRFTRHDTWFDASARPQRCDVSVKLQHLHSATLLERPSHTSPEVAFGLPVVRYFRASSCTPLWNALLVQAGVEGADVSEHVPLTGQADSPGQHSRNPLGLQLVLSEGDHLPGQTHE